MIFVLIGATIAFTVAGQLLLKSGMLEVGKLPADSGAFPGFALHALTNLKVVGGLACAVAASFAWMGAVSLSDISFAYPFMALPIVLVLLLSGAIFGETVPLGRWLGVGLVCLGLLVAARA